VVYTDAGKTLAGAPAVTNASVSADANESGDEEDVDIDAI